MRLLLIEDEDAIIRFLKHACERECFAIDVATTGEAGLQLAAATTYDCIILDNALPQKQGIAVCEELRAAGNTTPILMLSATSSSQAKINLLRAGADDYMTKPFSFDELIARIHAILRRSHTVTPEIFRINDLVIDIHKREVQRSGLPLQLTRKEFMLLEYFCRNQGLVLTRQMIMEHVWDMNADPFSNTIEAHMRSLRKKIGHTKESPLIHTVTGYGYRFDGTAR